MTDPNPPPKDHDWLLKDSPDGRDAVQTTEFVRGVVKEHLTEQLVGAINTDDEEGQAKLDGVVDVETLTRLQAMRDKSDRAMVYHTAAVAADGNYRYSPDEASTIKDWLAEALDEAQTKSSEWYDLSFIAGELIPYMQSQDIPNAAILWASGYKKKARASVPLLRLLFKQSPRNLPKRVREVIGWVTDSTKTKKDIVDAQRKARGIKKLPMAYGAEKILPNGRTQLIIIADTPEQYAAIKKRLKGLVDIKPETNGPGADL